MTNLTKIKIPAYLQVVVAVVIAIIFGSINPTLATEMKPLGDLFIKLVKMCIAPIIFSTICLGIIGSSSLGRVGKIGFKALIYFEILTTIAMLIGLALALFIKPGSNMHIDPANLSDAKISEFIRPQSSFTEFILNIVPATIFEAFTKGDLLSIVLISIIFGCALATLKDSAPTAIKLVEELSTIMFKILGFLMKFAPLGAFGAMSYTIGKYGLHSLLPLAKLMGCFYLTCFFFVIFVLGFILKLCGSSIFSLIKHIKEEIFLTIATSSSEPALPGLMKKMEKFGCEKSITGLVIPSGYSFNLDGTCIYFTMAVIFLAQAFNIDLSTREILSIISVLLFTSKGAAGVTGSGFVTLAATLSMVGSIPTLGLALILGIDRFMSEARAVTNLIGNATAAVAISRLEKIK